MADTSLYLDIHKDTVAAVLVDKSTKTPVVIGCGAVDLGEDSFEAAIDRIKEQIGFSSGDSVVTLGAELFFYRNLSLPFIDKKKIEQVLPFELEDRLPVEVKSMLVDFVVAKQGPEGADIIAAMINREFLADKLSILNSRNINPDSVGISGLSTVFQTIDGESRDTFVLIDIGTSWASVFIVLERQVALIRSLAISTDSEGQPDTAQSFFKNIKQTILASRLIDATTSGFCVYITGMTQKIDTDSLSHCLDGADIRRCGGTASQCGPMSPEVMAQYTPELMDRVLGCSLKSGSKPRGFNFRKDAFKKRKSAVENRKLLLKGITPLALIILALIGYWTYEYRTLLDHQDKLRDEIAGVFRETVAGVDKVVNPVQQLQVINNQIRATYKPGGGKTSGFSTIDLLVELSARIPATYKVKMVRLVADDDTLRLRGITGDYNTVDNIQKELEKSTFFKNVVINSANQSSQNEEVSFELKLDFAGK
jgi:general secretion pathway protein L